MITEIKKRKLDHPLYCITGEEYSLGRSTAAVVEQMLAGGAKIIQYREKEKTKQARLDECRLIRTLTREHGATFIVNDDVDIAVEVGADGVHVGQSDMGLVEARAMAGEEMIIGISTHMPEQALQAVRDGADYLGAGPVYATQTKKDVVPAVGLAYLDYAVSHAGIPVVAIGGIKRHSLFEVFSHGASAVAMITEIVSAPDIAARVREILSAIAEIKKSLKKT